MSRDKLRTITRKLTGDELFGRTRIVEEMLFAEHLEYIRAMTEIKAPDLTDEQRKALATRWLRAREVLSAHAEVHVLMQQELQERGLPMMKLVEKYGDPLTEAGAIRQAVMVQQAQQQQQAANGVNPPPPEPAQEAE